jgi:anti-sigma B factor antagonist
MYDRPLQTPAAPHLDVLSDGRIKQARRGQLTISTAAARGGTAVVRLHGQLDLRTVPQAQETLSAYVATGVQRVVVDLSYLQFIAVAGTRALLEAQTLLMTRGGWMALARPQPIVARVLQLTGADQQLPVYDTIGGAVRGRVPMPSRAP